MNGRMKSKDGNGSSSNARVSTERGLLKKARIANGDGSKISAAETNSSASISSAIRTGATTTVRALEPGPIGTVTIGAGVKRTHGGSARRTFAVVNQTAIVGGESASDNSRTSAGRTIGVSTSVTGSSCSAIAFAFRPSRTGITVIRRTRTIGTTSTIT